MTAAGTFALDTNTYASSTASTTVNSQTCTLGSSCTIPFQTNGSGNTSQAGINLLTSTTNTVGLTVTPTNSATNTEKFEVTGTYSGNISSAQMNTAVSDLTGCTTAGYAWVPEDGQCEAVGGGGGGGGTVEFRRPTANADYSYAGCTATNKINNGDMSGVYSGKLGAGPTGATASIDATATTGATYYSQRVFTTFQAASSAYTAETISIAMDCTIVPSASCKAYYSTDGGSTWTALASLSTTTAAAVYTATITGATQSNVQIDVCMKTSALLNTEATSNVQDIWTTGNLPSTVVQTNQANTYTTGLQDFSAATMKLPLTATASGGGTLTWPTTTGTVALTSAIPAAQVAANLANSSSTGVTGILPGANGGTGVANTGITETFAANFTTTGTGAPTLAFPATTSYTYTFPAATNTLLEESASDTTTTHVLHASATTGVGTFGTIASGDLPAATPTAAGAVIKVANTTFTTSTGSVAANTCNSTVQVAMTGVTTSMTFTITPSADTSAAAGWGSTGGLILDPWPTSGYLNYKICNQTTAAISTPGAVTFNVSAQ
jgi:hypothetical protein